VGLKDDLLFLTERGERLADRLDLLVRAARPLASDPLPEPAPRPAERPQSDATDPPGTHLRSQAERDLLRALRMAR
jgi:hypothetical protein